MAQARLRRDAVRLAVVAVLAFAHPARAATPHRVVQAETIVRLLRAGRSVTFRHVLVHGSLRLPPTMNGALVLRDSTIQGDVIVGAQEVHNLVDLSGTRITGSIQAVAARLDGPLLLLRTRTGQAVDFTFAVFGGAAVFAGADFGGRATFTGAQFHGESRFERVHFERTASFAFAGFDHSADFDLANFDGAASFARAELRGPASFAYAGFSGAVAFDNARFFAPADFLAAQLMPTTRHPFCLSKREMYPVEHPNSRTRQFFPTNS